MWQNIKNVDYSLSLMSNPFTVPSNKGIKKAQNNLDNKYINSDGNSLEKESVILWDRKKKLPNFASNYPPTSGLQ